MTRRARGAVLLLAVLALGSANSDYDCDGQEGYDTFAEMVTATDEFGETSYEDSCGAHVTLNDNDVLEETLGDCSEHAGGHSGGGNYAYEGVSPPNSPEVLSTMGCDTATKTAHVRFSWVAPNGNGAAVDRYEVSVWSESGDMVRSYAVADAATYQMADGSFRLVENKLPPGSYRAHVTAFNSAGQSADGVSLHVEVDAKRPPARATISAWGEAGEVHVKAVSGNAADVCNAPSSYTIHVFAAGADPSGADDIALPALDVSSGAMEHIFRTSSDVLAESSLDRLKNGKAYRFSVTASSDRGTAAPSVRSVAVVARDAPTTPIITYCADGGFGCKRVENCTGALSFNWADATARGVASDALLYTVEAFVDDETAPAQTVHSKTPTLAMASMGWALGREIRFRVRATSSWDGGSYASRWSDLTPPTALPGPAATPAISASVALAGVGAGHDAVTVSWSNAALRWFPGEAEVKRFTVKGVGSRGEVSAVICAVATCRPGLQWPTYCDNARCATDYVFSGASARHKSVIRYDKWDAAGLSFSVEARAKYHSNCAASSTYGHAVFLVGPPAPPAKVILASRSIRSKTGGALVVSFSPSPTREGVLGAPTSAYKVELFSDDIGYGPQQSGEIAVAASGPGGTEPGMYSYAFSGLQNGMRYYAKVSAKNRRDWGEASAPSNTLDPMPHTYLSVTGGALKFDDVSTSQFHEDPAVREVLTSSIASAVSTASTVAVTPGMVSVTGVSDSSGSGESARRVLLTGTTLVVSFDIDIPILPGADSTSSVANNYAATHAADLISLMLENNGPSFMDALKASLRASSFDYVPSSLANDGIDKTVHENEYKGAVSYADSGDVRVQGIKSKGVAGMSSYAFALLLCAVGVTVLGATLAVMARRRTLQVDGGFPSAKATPGALSAQDGNVLGSPVKTPSAGGGSSFGVAAGWKRASIKAPMQLGGGIETSFFENDDEDEEGGDDFLVEDATPEDFVNPALAKHSKKESVADAAKRQALRKTSKQFMKSGSKKNLHGLKKKASARNVLHKDGGAGAKDGAGKPAGAMGLAMGGIESVTEFTEATALPDDGAEPSDVDTEFGSL
jgi:hypothetical protein